MTPLYILFALVILVLVLILIGRAARRRRREEERWVIPAPPRAPKGAGGSRRVRSTAEERGGAGVGTVMAEPSSRSGGGGSFGSFGPLDRENVQRNAEKYETLLEEMEARLRLLRSDGGGVGGSAYSRRGVGGEASSVPEPSEKIATPPPRKPSPIKQTQKKETRKKSSDKQETQKKVSGKQEAKILQASAGETHRRTTLAVAQRTTRSPTTVSDTVDCTVFAPPTVPARDSFMIQVFAHLQEHAEEAQKLAQRFDGEAEARGFVNLEVEVERGSKLTFHLVMPGLEIDEPLKTLVWRGSPASVQFGGTVMKGHPGGNVIGTVTISQAGVPVGHIKFKLTVTATKQSLERKLRPAGDAARHYERAFVSYASQDRNEVLKRVQMLARLGIEYFQDVLTLEPGQRWERELYRHIDESDLFLLFWSSAAKQSQWVHKEVQYAIARRGDDELAPPEIVPIPIEGPPVTEPPPELAHLHFNDYLLYFMAQEK